MMVGSHGRGVAGSVGVVVREGKKNVFATRNEHSTHRGGGNSNGRERLSLQATQETPLVIRAMEKS